jgi:thiamine-phosphate pyrophosphorylase
MELPNIQYITRDSANFTHAQQALLMFQNGVNWVQLRMKNASEPEIIRQAEEAMDYAKTYNGLLTINDSITVARKVKSHGIHLGLNDVSLDEARRQLGEGVVIGGTANTFSHIVHQASLGADYIGLGPFRFTETKNNLSPVIGLEGYRLLCQQAQQEGIGIPIIGVGGINLIDVDELMAAGLHGVAISGALFQKHAPLSDYHIDDCLPEFVENQ